MLIMPIATENRFYKDILWVLQCEDRLSSAIPHRSLLIMWQWSQGLEGEKKEDCNFHNSFLLVEAFCSILFILLLREWARRSCSRSCNMTANHNLNYCK